MKPITYVIGFMAGPLLSPHRPPGSAPAIATVGRISISGLVCRKQHPVVAAIRIMAASQETAGVEAGPTGSEPTFWQIGRVGFHPDRKRGGQNENSWQSAPQRSTATITSNSNYGAPPCRLVRQGAEIWVERRAFPPKSPVPATKVAGDGAIMRIADGTATLLGAMLVGGSAIEPTCPNE